MTILRNHADTGLLLMVLMFRLHSHHTVVAVKWKRETTEPIILHRNVTLKCIVPNTTCCDQGSRQWQGGPGNKLLSFNEDSTDYSKYDSKLLTDGFTLVIQDFSFGDADLPYTCTYIFDSFTSSLTLGDTYELHPTNETTEEYLDISVSEIKSKIMFAEIHPVPKCRATLDEMDLSSLLNISSRMTNKFYKVNITFKYNITDDVCSGQFNIHCDVGTTNIPIIRGDIVTGRNCTEVKENTTKDETEHTVESERVIVIALVSSFISLCFIGACALVLYKRRQKKRTTGFSCLFTKNSGSEHEEQQSREMAILSRIPEDR